MDPAWRTLVASAISSCNAGTGLRTQVMAVGLPRLHTRNNNSVPSSSIETSPTMASTSDDMEQAAQDRFINRNIPDTDSSPTPEVEDMLLRSKLSRHTLGILLLFLVVVLWVSGNFLTWTLFSDETYSKPYLVSYVNSTIFSAFLIPWIRRGGITELRMRWKEGERPWGALDKNNRGEYTRIESRGDQNDSRSVTKEGKLGLFATIRLSAEFAILWWLANYFSSVCYVYTSAASGSILGSTSSEFSPWFHPVNLKLISGAEKL